MRLLIASGTGLIAQGEPALVTTRFSKGFDDPIAERHDGLARSAM